MNLASFLGHPCPQDDGGAFQAAPSFCHFRLLRRTDDRCPCVCADAHSSPCSTHRSAVGTSDDADLMTKNDERRMAKAQGGLCGRPSLSAFSVREGSRSACENGVLASVARSSSQMACLLCLWRYWWGERNGGSREVMRFGLAPGHSESVVEGVGPIFVGLEDQQPAPEPVSRPCSGVQGCLGSTFEV